MHLHIQCSSDSPKACIHVNLKEAEPSSLEIEAKAHTLPQTISGIYTLAKRGQYNPHPPPDLVYGELKTQCERRDELSSGGCTTGAL